MSEDLSDYGCVRARCLNAQELDGAFMGNGIFCNLVLTSGSNVNAVDNRDNRIELVIGYGAVGTSTLGIYETNGGAPFRDPSMPNLRIAGVAEPIDDQDMATKKYTDDTLVTLLHIHNPVVANIDLQISGLTGYVYNSGAGTITVNALAPVFSADNVGADVTADNVEILLTNRVIFTNVGGGANPTNPNVANGVYTLTSVAGGGGALVFTRAIDLDSLPELLKGEYTVVDSSGNTGTSSNNGVGYVLSNTITDLAVTPQDWHQFGSSTVQTFSPVLYDDANTVRCRGDIGGADELKALLAGNNAADGIGTWNFSMGKSTEAFEIVGTNNKVGDANISGTFAVNATTGATLTGPTTLVTSTTSTTINSTGGFTIHNGNKHTFAKNVGGTAATNTLAAITIAQARNNGHITAHTNQFLDGAGAEEFGAGFLLDQSVDFNGGGGTNTNGGRFLLCPRNLGGGSNTTTLSVLGFDTGVAGAGNILCSFT